MSRSTNESVAEFQPEHLIVLHAGRTTDPIQQMVRLGALALTPIPRLVEYLLVEFGIRYDGTPPRSELLACIAVDILPAA